MKMLFFLLLALLLSNCKKKELEGDLSGLCGKWQAKRTCFYWGSESDIYLSDSSSFINSPVELEIKQKGELVFTSTEGVETFRIIKYTIKEESLQIRDTDGNLLATNTQNVYFTLATKKGQRFYFNYHFNNADDSSITGDFWRKGQVYHSIQSPNSTYDINPLFDGGSVVNEFELEAQFKKTN